MRRIIAVSIFSVYCLMAFAQSDRQFVREGNRLYRDRQYDKAETAYRKALDKNPRNPQASYDLGCAMMKQGNQDAALNQFKRTTDTATDKDTRALSYYNMGVLQQKQKKYAEAIENYKNTLRLNPNDGDARKNLAICKKQQQSQQQQGGQDNQDDKDNEKDKKDRNNQNDKKDKKQDDKDKKQEQNKQQVPEEQQKEKIDKENVDQLLNAAMQEEKATQERLKKAMQQSTRRQLDKNW